MSGYFETNYNMTEDEQKKEMYDLERRKAKRTFSRAYDETESAILKKERDLSDARKAAGDDDFDMDDIVDTLDDIEILRKTLDRIKAEYKLAFGEDMVVVA